MLMSLLSLLRAGKKPKPKRRRSTASQYRTTPTQTDPSASSEPETRGRLGAASAQSERHIIISDYHIRTYEERGKKRTAHDRKAMQLVERFMEAWKPTDIWYNGDILDGHQVSTRFCRDPRQALGLHQDVREMRSLLQEHHRAHPEARKRFLMGNHDIRVENFLAEKALALADLPELQVGVLFGLDALGIEVYPYKERVELCPGVFVTHGEVARKGSGQSARAQHRGLSGISGHTHRLGHVWETDLRGTIEWVEGGCLCSLTPDYIAAPDWQQGFTTVCVDRARGRYEIRPVAIRRAGRSYWLMYDGEMFEI